MTSTTVTNAQSFGTSTNVGTPKYITRTAIQTGTTAYVVTGQITNGTGNYLRGTYVRVWFTSSPVDITNSGTDIPDRLESTARYVDVFMLSSAGRIVIKDGTLEPITGGFIYTWCELPATTVAATLSVIVTELP